MPDDFEDRAFADDQQEMPRMDPERKRKGYNEQNPSRPHGSFKPDRSGIDKAGFGSVK
ncbi:MAG TPA: hypothetical protein VKR32_17840 [Puia sp.]|nr:hypothetical protein [Puia sp.]